MNNFYKLSTVLALLTALFLPSSVLAEEEAKQPIFYTIQPVLLTNLKHEGEPVFVQARMEIMTFDPDVVEAVKTHSHQFRHAVLLILNEQTPEIMRSPTGSAMVRKQALIMLKKILKKENAKADVEQVLFSEVLIQ